MLTDTAKAYIAGIIDGEGCIAITRSGTHYNIRVVIKTTSEPLAKWLIESTGLGQRIQYRKDKRKTERLPCFEWRVFSNQALSLLAAVYPYVVVKRQQAEIAMGHQRLPVKERQNQGAQNTTRLKSLGLREQHKVYFATQRAANGTTGAPAGA